MDEDQDIFCQLLLSLPKNSDPITTALETISPEKFTVEFVMGLIDAKIKKIHGDDFENQNLQYFDEFLTINYLVTSSTKLKRLCRNCNLVEVLFDVA